MWTSYEVPRDQDYQTWPTTAAVEVQKEEMVRLPAFSQFFPLHPTEISLQKRCLETDSESDSGAENSYSISPVKKFKPSKPPQENVSVKEIDRFLKIVDDPVVFDFLTSDGCKIVADKYLIAMVFAYFKRANFKAREYTKMNFFLALYLASDMEEDEEDSKYEIFPWALGKNWRDKYMKFLRRREKLWERMEFRAAVSSICCEEIMSVRPDHWVWQRQRHLRHSGAVRNLRDEEEGEDEEAYPRGPGRTPLICNLCAEEQNQYDSASPDNMPWYLSSSSESSPEIFLQDRNKCRSVRCNLQAIQSRFDMQGMRSSLQDDDIWAHDE